MALGRKHPVVWTVHSYVRALTLEMRFPSSPQSDPMLFSALYLEALALGGCTPPHPTPPPGCRQAVYESWSPHTASGSLKEVSAQSQKNKSMKTSWPLGHAPPQRGESSGSQVCFLLQRLSHQTDWPEVSQAHPR